MKDLKYLFAYTIPLSALVSFQSNGVACYTTVFYAFIILPLLDILTGETKTNFSKESLIIWFNLIIIKDMIYLFVYNNLKSIYIEYKIIIL